ncbi:MAG: FN3 associated domain-containing protein, partial [Pseudomonadota bacterium]|nr:FN3 associated domain-containing protein [Pseudomonadota bacterium]
FHRPDALETLKRTAINQDYWRDEGGYVNKGPFPPPATEVKIQRLSRDDVTGEAILKITPIHGDTVYYEIGDSEPTTASLRVDSLNNFKTGELQARFLCVDSTCEHQTGAAETWENSINLKYRVFQQGEDWMVELQAYPKGEIRYTTDGSDPKNFGAVYSGPFPVSPESPFVLAIARQDGVSSSQETINVKQYITKTVTIEAENPVAWKRRHTNLTTRNAHAFMERLEKFQGTAYGVTIDVQSNDETQEISYSGAETFGLKGDDFGKLVKCLQDAMHGGQFFLSIERLNFARGQELLDWVADAKTQLQPGETSQ